MEKNLNIGCRKFNFGSLKFIGSIFRHSGTINICLKISKLNEWDIQIAKKYQNFFDRPFSAMALSCDIVINCNFL